MKGFFKKSLSVFCALLLLLAVAVPALAAGSPFDDDAYADVLTGSDFQDLGTKAYDRFGRVLAKMKADGMPTPDSMLVGGDYTRLLFDYASPGITQIRDRLTDAYPDADPDAVVCIQGNHDNINAGFTKTGFHDMGTYALYAINEDDFPWQQRLQPWVNAKVQKLAADMESCLNGMIEKGDLRPVIVLTHLPLHHTSRAGYADNQYAAHIFNVLNKAAETLDVIFLFGHQHSGDYDDYIGGSVNFLQPGDTLRVPLTDKKGADCYTEETLNFTYANCGYIGYSNNTVSETSTDKLTVGVIRIGTDHFRFVKYSEDGFFAQWDVARKNVGGSAEDRLLREEDPALVCAESWILENNFFRMLFALLTKLRLLFSF